MIEDNEDKIKNIDNYLKDDYKNNHIKIDDDILKLLNQISDDDDILIYILNNLIDKIDNYRI